MTEVQCHGIKIDIKDLITSSSIELLFLHIRTDDADSLIVFEGSVSMYVLYS